MEQYVGGWRPIEEREGLGAVAYGYYVRRGREVTWEYGANERVPSFATHFVQLPDPPSIL